MKSRPHYYNPVKCRPDYFDWLVEPLTDDPFIRKNLQNKNRTRKSIYGNRRVLEDYPRIRDIFLDKFSHVAEEHLGYKRKKYALRYPIYSFERKEKEWFE